MNERGGGVQGAAGERGLSVRHASLVSALRDGRLQNRLTCFLITPVLTRVVVPSVYL